jgi:copper(I)-binding protein
MIRTLLTAAVLLVSPVLAVPAFAHDYVIGDLTIDHPWARPTVTTRQPGAAYFTIRNDGETDQRLIEARPIDFAEAAELHTHINDDGVMRMRVVEGGVVIPAGKRQLRAGRPARDAVRPASEPLTEGFRNR